MTFSRALFALLGSAAVLGAATLGFSPDATAEPATRSQATDVRAEPVLLELFTSQGCSSCPPADALAEQLSQRPGLVVIARPVTYWDRLGWKDTLAREENTALQQDYAQRGLAGRNGVYTPQLVIDGSFGAVGSDRGDVEAAIKRHAGKNTAAIRINDLGAEGIGVGLGGATDGPAELVLLAAARKVAVGIGSGENGGRKVTYTNVLREERRLAGWQGGKASYVIARDQLKVKGADRYALVLRVPGGGKVLAARWL